MRLAEICLREAAVTPAVASRLYWHGTDNKSGTRILKEGIRPGNEIVTTRAKDPTYLPPVFPGVYLTPDLRYALKFTETKQKYGWVFAIAGQDLTDLEIDEDEVGKAVRYGLQAVANPSNNRFDMDRPACAVVSRDAEFRDALLALASQHLPDDLMQHLRTFGKYSAKWMSDAGAALIPVMPDGMKQTLVDAGCHVVNRTAIVPQMAWRFPPAAYCDIHNAFNRNNDAAGTLDRMAERMR